MTADERAALEAAQRHGLAYTGLRGFGPDPRLFRYLPLELALAERVLPVVLVGDTLKVASARPDPDLSLLRERFPYLDLDIVLAPAGELDAALRRASDHH